MKLIYTNMHACTHAMQFGKSHTQKLTRTFFDNLLIGHSVSSVSRVKVLNGNAVFSNLYTYIDESLEGEIVDFEVERVGFEIILTRQCGGLSFNCRHSGRLFTCAH